MQKDCSENQSNFNDKLKAQTKQTQTQQQLQSFESTSEVQKTHRKIDLQLYLHFERLLGKNFYHYDKPSKYHKKHVSKQLIVNETIKYLAYLIGNIQPLAPKHDNQLLFLIQIWKNRNQLITNQYCIHQDFQDQTNPAKFILNFSQMRPRIDFKQFLSLDNWNHLLALGFYDCDWFDDDDWKIFVQHADSFCNLKWLILRKNQISCIREKDFEQFKFLSWIDLVWNPLSEQSKEVLKRLREKNNQMTIQYDE